jgi:CheY-like chemotaxis protein
MPQAGQSNDSSSEFAGSKVYALLLSGNPTIIRQLTESLQQLATSTLVCSDVPSALRVLDTRKFEAIVVDLELGEQTRAVLERVRLSPSNRTTVTFAITGSKEEMQMAFDAGSNFVLERPLSVASISRTLKAAYGLIMRERRRYFRCPVTIPAAMRGENMGEVACQAVNISEGGMAISTPVPLKPGAHVGVEFTLPGAAAGFTAKSEICWYNEAGRAGLQFVGLSPQQQSGLQEWLSHRLEEMLPESVTNKFRKEDA